MVSAQKIGTILGYSVLTALSIPAAMYVAGWRMIPDSGPTRNRISGFLGGAGMFLSAMGYFITTAPDVRTASTHYTDDVRIINTQSIEGTIVDTYGVPLSAGSFFSNIPMAISAFTDRNEAVASVYVSSAHGEGSTQPVIDAGKQPFRVACRFVHQGELDLTTLTQLDESHMVYYSVDGPVDVDRSDAFALCDRTMRLEQLAQ